MKTLSPKEYKLVPLRECYYSPFLCDTPERAVEYWRTVIATEPHYNPDVEILVALLLNTRRRVLGHHVISHGTLDTILCHPREVFRVAIVAAAAAMIIAHNHPSGDPTPSDADVKFTRDIIRAGQLLKIECLDSVVIGAPDCPSPGPFTSLRALGYFYS